MLAATIRYISLQLGSKGDKDPDKQSCITRLEELRCLKLEIPASAQPVLKTFMRDVVSGNDTPSDSYLLGFVHQFLLALYSAGYPEDLKISSILEQTLIFICLTEDLKWKSARHTYDELSYCFWWGRSLLVHTAALGGINNPYVSPPRSSNCQVFAELNDDTSNLNKTTCDLLTFDGLSGPEQQSEEESGLPQPNWELVVGYACVLLGFDTADSDLMCRHVRELSKKLINVEDRGNLVSRLYSVRSSALKEARTEPPGHRVVWHKDGTMLDLSWAYIHERSFELSAIRRAAFSVTEKLNQALLNLVPGAMEAIVARLSISSFREEWDANSIFSSLPSYEALSRLTRQDHRFYENEAYHLRSHSRAIPGVSESSCCCIVCHNRCSPLCLPSFPAPICISQWHSEAPEAIGGRARCFHNPFRRRPSRLSTEGSRQPLAYPTPSDSSHPDISWRFSTGRNNFTAVTCSSIESHHA
jgi:hypothetical protein